MALEGKAGCGLLPTGSPWHTACYFDVIRYWQTSLLAARRTEEHDNMVPVYATTRKPSVLTLLPKQTPLLWKLSWIKQLVWQRKTSASEAFLFRKTLRKGCELRIHTSTNTSPTPCGQCHMGADTFQPRTYTPGRCGWFSGAGGASTGIIFWIVSTFPF